MSPLKRLLSHFESSSQFTIAALQPSSFGNLPREIIHHIAEYLPTTSAAAFSVTCRSLNFILGNQHILALESENLARERYEFLQLLARDLPNHIACYYCMKLHTIENAKTYLYTQRYPKHIDSRFPEICCLGVKTREVNFSIHYNFSVSVFPMAMKRFRQDAVGSTELLDLLTRKPRTYLRQDHGCAEQKATWLRIVSGSLLVSQQNIYLIPVDKPISEYHALNVCVHDPWANIHSENLIGSVLQSRRVCWRLEASLSLNQCEYCFTEFRLDFKIIGRFKAIFFTRWKDLGEGTSMLDEKWQSHMDSNVPKGDTTPQKVHFEEGSIFAAVELDSEFQFDSLMSPENEKELLEMASRLE